MSFLKELQDGLGQVDLEQVEEPAVELEDDDEVVGVLPEELQRLYALKVKASEAHRAIHGEILQFCGRHISSLTEPPPEFDQLAQRHNLAVHRAEALDNLFWTSVRIEFPELANKGTIGLAEEWQVYWRKPRKSNVSPLAALIKLLAEAEAE